MSKLSIKALEGFLLSDNLEDFFSKMPPKSENVCYLRLLSRLTGRAGNQAEFFKLATDFLKNEKFSKILTRKVLAFKILTELENNKADLAKQKQLLQLLNKEFLRFNFSFRKPKQVETNNLNLQNFGEDEQKLLEERKLLKDHIDQVSSQHENLTVEGLQQIEAFLFFQTFDLSKIDLSKLDKKLFKALIKKVCSGSLPSAPGLRAFVKSFASLDAQRIEWCRTEFMGSLNKIPREWMEDYINVPYWRTNEKFLKAYITKKFEIRCSTLPEQPQDVLEKVLKFVETLGTKFIRMQKGIRFLLLRRQMENAKFNRDAFTSYLEDPLYTKTVNDRSRFVYKNQISMRTSEQAKLNVKKHLKLLSGDLAKGHGDVIDEHLRHFFAQGDSVSTWLPYFDENFLKRLFFKEGLLRGELPEGFEETLSESEVRTLTEKKTLTLLKSNSKRFGPGEVVELELELKNIQKLRVKIFQINIENALLENPKVDFSQMDLLGLVARDELAYTFEKPPLQRWKEKFTFESIDTSERGVFIIDFITGRVSSRAVIHKGSLALVYQKLKLGSKAWILDEKRRVCSGSRTGVYIAKKFYQANEKGEIIVPYNVAVSSNQVISCHDNFAVLSSLEVCKPDFNLSLQLIFNSEQLRAGNQVDFLLLPDLTLNGRDFSLSQAKSFSLEVNIRGELGNHKKIELAGSDLEIKDKRFFKVPLVFLPKTVSIDFKLLCKVGLLGTDERTVTASKRLSFLGTESRPLQQAYITRQNDKSYEIQIRGRNGEPRKNQEFSVNIESIGLTQSSRNGVLTVSDAGAKNIGDMTQVQNFHVNCVGARTQSRKWIRATSTEYAKTALIVEGDTVDIPVHNPGKVCMFSILHDGKREEFIESASDINLLDDLSGDSDKIEQIGDNMIRLKNLPVGAYFLVLSGQNPVDINPVYIRVMKGERFSLGERDFIEWNDQYVEVRNKAAYHLLLSEENEGETTSRVLSGGVRIHSKAKFEEDKAPVVKTEAAQVRNLEGILMCYNFINHENMELPTMNSGGEHHMMHESNFIKSRTDNGYYSNKMLDEEIIYVLQRKGLNEFMGNTLDKPSMLLKRAKVQATVMENQELKKERDFAIRNKSRGGHGRMHANRMAKAQITLNTIDLSYDFLKTPGKIIGGIHFDAEGRPEIPENQIKGYNYVQLVVNFGGEAFLTQTVRDSWTEPQLQDLRLETMKKPGYVYRNIRALRPLNSGNTSQIQNVENTEFWTLGSLAELMKAQGVLSPQHSAGLKEWDFLAKWNEMKPSDKLKKYDKFYSHELNIFVYFKDREFFDEVVAPFIENKKDKSPVDLFLLGRKEEAQRFLSTPKNQELNHLEIILLLILCHDHPAAQAIADRLRSESGLSRNKPGIPYFKRLFENLLNSKKNADASKPSGLAAPPISNEISNIAPRVMLAQAMPRRLRGVTNRMDRAPQRHRHRREMAPRHGNRRRNHRQDERMQNDLMLERAASIGDFSDSDGLNDSLVMNVEDNFKVQDEMFQKASAKVYQPMESTSEYVEKTYYYRNSANFTSNAFYSGLADYLIANNGETQGFLNENFIYCTKSMTELIFVLSVTDLPYKAKGLDQNLQKNKVTLSASSNVILFVKEISEALGSPADVDFLVSQRFYDPEDRFYHLEDGSKMEKPVKEFVQGRQYGCRVVVTNSTDQSVSIITEIPEGAIALKPSDSLKVHPIQVKSFMSSVIDLSFYFPTKGEFKMYPATVAKDDSIFATAKSMDTITVKPKKETVVLESISDVLSAGKISDILHFLENKNLLDSNVFSFKNIGWLMKDKSFYSSVLDILRKKGLFFESAWRFSVFHNDIQALQELLDSNTAQRSLHVMQFFANSLVRIDRHKTKDYFPLINPRAHSIKAKGANIMNKQFRDTYKNFLHYLSEKPNRTTEDSILWVTYLLLQDRVFEAKELFQSISPEARQTAETRIQSDYIEAYIDFIIGFPDFKRAKEICEEYLDYPVLGWRNLFVEIANQLSEYEESDLKSETDVSGKKQSKTKHADKSPYLAAEMDSTNIKVSYRNQNSLSIEFYQIDIEVLFTQDPFETKLNSSLTNVLPFLRQSHTLESKSDFQVTAFPVPTALATQNLLLRVIDDSKQSVLLKYIPFNLEAVLNQQYGILKLLDRKTNRPVPKVYVKCFAKMAGGAIRFFKDGYTDLRGSFDFASMNSSGKTNAQKFRLLVSSAQFGSKILEADPPVSSLRVEGKAKKIRSKAYRNVRAKKGKKKMKYQLSDYSLED